MTNKTNLSTSFNMTNKANKILAIMYYTDQILDLIADQLRNDENTLTQSDLQAVIQTLVTKILNERR